MLQSSLCSNFVVSNSEYLLSQSFWGSGIQAHLSWALCFTVSWMSTIKVSTNSLHAHLKSWLGKDLLLSLLLWWLAGLSSYLAGVHPQFLSRLASSTQKLALSKCASWDGNRKNMPAGWKSQFIILSQKWYLISVITFYLLQALESAHTRGAD